MTPGDCDATWAWCLGPVTMNQENCRVYSTTRRPVGVAWYTATRRIANPVQRVVTITRQISRRTFSA